MEPCRRGVSPVLDVGPVVALTRVAPGDRRLRAGVRRLVADAGSRGRAAGREALLAASGARRRRDRERGDGRHDRKPVGPDLGGRACQLHARRRLASSGRGRSAIVLARGGRDDPRLPRPGCRPVPVGLAPVRRPVAVVARRRRGPPATDGRAGDGTRRGRHGPGDPRARRAGPRGGRRGTAAGGAGAPRHRRPHRQRHAGAGRSGAPGRPDLARRRGGIASRGRGDRARGDGRAALAARRPGRRRAPAPGLAAPEPGVGQLEGLVDRVRQAGLPAEIEIDGSHDRCPRAST